MNKNISPRGYEKKIKGEVMLKNGEIKFKSKDFSLLIFGLSNAEKQTLTSAKKIDITLPRFVSNQEVANSCRVEIVFLDKNNKELTLLNDELQRD